MPEAGLVGFLGRQEAQIRRQDLNRIQRKAFAQHLFCIAIDRGREMPLRPRPVSLPQSLGPRVDRRRNEALPLGQTSGGLPDQIHGMDSG